LSFFVLALLIASPSQEWPRIAVTMPFADLLGWRSDTAWVHETIIHDLAGETEETMIMVTEEGCEPASVCSPGPFEPGTGVSSMASILDGTSVYLLEVTASDDELQYMADACMDFQDHLDGDPPVVPVHMTLIRRADSTEAWSAARDLTWFGGECAPMFDLPVLDSAVLSPDSSLVFFSILYGPYMEYFVVPSGF